MNNSTFNLMSGTSMAPYAFQGYASVPQIVQCPDGGQAEVQVLPREAYERVFGFSQEHLLEQLKSPSARFALLNQ